MSKSYHSTRSDLRGKTRTEIDEMIDDPDSILHELATKKYVKRMVKKGRRDLKATLNKSS